MATNEKQKAIVGALCLDEDGGAAATFRRFVEMGVCGEMFTDSVPSAVWGAAKRLEEARPGAWSKVDLQDALNDHPTVFLDLSQASITAGIYPHLVPQYAQDLITDYRHRQIFELMRGARDRIEHGQDATNLIREMGELYSAGGSVVGVRLPTGLRLSREEVKQYEALGDTENANETCTNPRPLPPFIVNGWIRQREFGTVTGPSKTRKTWFLMHLGVSAAYGVPFFGIAVPHPGPVLFLNYELLPGGWDERLISIRNASRVPLDSMGVFRTWQLRGKSLNYKDLSPAIQYRLWKEGWKTPPTLIIIDPAFRTWTGTDELASGEMSKAMEAFGKLVEDLGATVVTVLHATKGRQGGKRALDASSGAGVQGRAVDFNLNLNIADKDLLANVECPLTKIEPTLRHGAPPPAFCIQFDKSKGALVEASVLDFDSNISDGWTPADWLPAFPNEDARLRAKELIKYFTTHSENKSDSSAESYLKAALGGTAPLLAKSGKGNATRYFLTPAGIEAWRKSAGASGDGTLQAVPEDEF